MDEHLKLNLISFNQAIALKELGFPQFENETLDRYLIGPGIKNNYTVPTWGYKDNYRNIDYVYAPSQELVIKWFRDEKGIYINPHPRYHKTPIDGWKHIDWENVVEDWTWKVIALCQYFQTYEEACSAGIDKAIKHIKENI